MYTAIARRPDSPDSAPDLFDRNVDELVVLEVEIERELAEISQPEPAPEIDGFDQVIEEHLALVEEQQQPPVQEQQHDPPDQDLNIEEDDGPDLGPEDIDDSPAERWYQEVARWRAYDELQLEPDLDLDYEIDNIMAGLPLPVREVALEL